MYLHRCRPLIINPVTLAAWQTLKERYNFPPAYLRYMLNKWPEYLPQDMTDWNN